MIGIIFGSSMGNTEEAAEFIGENLGLENEVLNVTDVNPAKINSYDKLIVGTSTWGSGDLQDDWDSFDFSALNLNGKVVAFFGMGDSQSYSDEYCNGMAKLYDAFVKQGAKAVGSVSTDGYTFDGSDAVRDGKFVGLALDADNESEKTEERILAWIEQIKPLFS
ncbi:flavodoxin [Campylobacter mucosalis]|uniref:Flavodoxin n=1 Tax=Campylobacter mucosalis CCUG 21559 TaxID=1032067 RepID=A0A6G5QG28_9BACT|nr:flavodoxin FldA [Campylobacter mucosalis]KEA46109.1 flavodoxin [Campylobacter mucosalis]QCD44592.1 flavodoxin [Campylobacter mucosalis CCUG 21559]QKF62558.1 flavodoxin [Campylobacter mucosalis]